MCATIKDLILTAGKSFYRFLHGFISDDDDRVVACSACYEPSHVCLVLRLVRVDMDVVIFKNRLAKHVEYTLEFVDDQRFLVEELRQNLFFED